MADKQDEKRDGQRFIGHTSELDTFKRWLTNTDPNAPWILFFHDAFEQPEKKGGVGKTWLLRECAALAKQHDEQVAVVIIDFFSIADRDGAEIARLAHGPGDDRVAFLDTPGRVEPALADEDDAGPALSECLMKAPCELVAGYEFCLIQ